MSIEPKPKALVWLIMPLLAIGAACRDGERASGVASARSGADAAGPASSAPNAAERQIAYARCLREHGVVVADPGPGQSVKIEGDKTPTLRAALDACRTLAPATEADNKLDPAQLLAYSVCIRSNGFPEFPDPSAEGELLIPKSMVGAPAFEAAEQVCARELGKPSGEASAK